MIDTQTPALLTMAEVCERLHRTPDTVRSYIVTGVHGVRLRAAKVGSAWRINEMDLADFLAQLCDAVPQEAA